MSLELYLAFVLATAVLIVVPGPANALIVANSIAHGARRTRPSWYRGRRLTYRTTNRQVSHHG